MIKITNEQEYNKAIKEKDNLVWSLFRGGETANIELLIDELSSSIDVYIKYLEKNMDTCPFCGNGVHIDDSYHTTNNYFIRCSKCGAIVEFKDIEGLIKTIIAYNTRVGKMS